MRKKKIISADEAALWVKDEMTITTSGFVACALPEALNSALERRFLETGAPKNLTLFYASSQGNQDGSGAEHFAHAGMTKRVIGGHWNMVPKLGQMVLDNQIEGYNLPQGPLCKLYREIASHSPGCITSVGLGTFVDPRNGGGKLNSISTEDYVDLFELNGREYLLFKSFPLDIAFVRGTYADEYGYVTVEHEVAPLEVTSLTQAVHNCGGKVIVQVEQVVPHGTLDPKLVKIPGIYVDALVVCARPEDHAQCRGCAYDGSMTGDYKVTVERAAGIPMSAKKIIARRAAMQLKAGAVVNLGIGTPEYVAKVAAEEGIVGEIVLTVENGPIGGIPQGGCKFGGAVNPEALIDQPYQFDFYDGGGLDMAFLGLAQGDKNGNINVSKFGPRIAGCGGFINITQNSKQVFFCGTFTAGGLQTHIEDGRLIIDQEGREQKLVSEVEQITFSGLYARHGNQTVMYITERAVFELRADGVYLTEIAPGIDLQSQILGQMGFLPKIPQDGIKTMDPRIFTETTMGLGKHFN